MDLTDKLVAWEDGQLDLGQEVELFQKLVDSGLAWQLQGMYGRRAMSMIEQGLIKAN